MSVIDPASRELSAAWGVPGFPSEQVGRLVFERLSAFRRGVPHWRHRLGEGQVCLVAFRQTLGLVGTFRGILVYRMEFEVTVEALEPVAADRFYGDSRLLEPGEQLVERGTLSFELTPQGWRGEDGELYGQDGPASAWGARYRRVQRASPARSGRFLVEA